MAGRRDPIDAEAARKTLRAYAFAMPAAALVGGGCTLLQLAWLLSPEDAVDHAPAAVRVLTFVAAAAWFYLLHRTFKHLPAVIDDILDRGLIAANEPANRDLRRDHR